MKYYGILSLLLLVMHAEACPQTADQSSAFPLQNAGENSSDGTKQVSETSAKLLAAAAAYEVPVWTISPAAESQPAFRYEFWPHASELKPGKAQLYYFRAVAAIQQPEEALQTIRAISRLDNCSTPEVRTFLKSMKPVFDNLERMAFCEDTSWDRRNQDATGVRLLELGVDDFQLARDLVRLLAFKAAVQRADRDFHGVSRTVLIGNRLAYLLGHGESIIQCQIAAALSAIIRNVTQETIQTPGCPNLYWAIATMPQPLIDSRPAVELNLQAIHTVFPELRAATTADWPEQTSRKKWSECLSRLTGLYGPMERQTRWIKDAEDCSSFVDAARQRLLGKGFAGDRLDRMPKTSIVMADACYELDRLIDETRKLMILPPGQRRFLQQLSNAGFDIVGLLGDELEDDAVPESAATLFASSSIGSIRQLQAAVTRTPVMLRRLMTLEAIRQYAAVHNGQLPNSLAELNMLPVVRAFGSEEPFQYSVEQTDDGPIGILTGDIPNFPAARQLKFRIAAN